MRSQLGQHQPQHMSQLVLHLLLHVSLPLLLRLLLLHLLHLSLALLLPLAHGRLQLQLGRPPLEALTPSSAGGSAFGNLRSERTRRLGGATLSRARIHRSPTAVVQPSHATR